MSTTSRPVRHRYSFAEYLAYEADSGMKHEDEAGEIFAMAGGSRRHNALATDGTLTLACGAVLALATLYADLPP